MRNRDGEYLDKLRDYYAEHRVLPSYSTMMALVGLRSTSTVSAFVTRMKTVGMLVSAPNGRMQPGQRFFERAALEPQSEGMPQAALDPSVQGLNVDAYLIDQPPRTVLQTMPDDSMVEAGLLPSDTVVVKKSVPVLAGNVVVATVDGQLFVRFLARDPQGFYLKPGNSSYATIRSSQDLEIMGRVVASFRKYSQSEPGGGEAPS